MGVRYCTREDVVEALDVNMSARVARQIDRHVEAASRSVETTCRGRVFYSVDATRYFDYPSRSRRGQPSWRLWLDEHELQSVTTLSSGGVTISASDFYLEPVNDGPPYRSIELDRAADAVFTTADNGSPQRSITVTGRFGGYDEREQIGSTSGTVTAAHTKLTFNPEQVGVGDTVVIDDEYIHLTDVELADTGQNLTDAMTASMADRAVDVADGSAFLVDEVVYVDSEAMLVTAITSNTLTVTRGHDGTVLAAHSSGADVYAYRRYTTERGALGSTAASHTDGTAVYVLRYPPLVTTLAVAEAIVGAQNEQSGFARMMTNWAGRSLQAGIGLDSLREDCALAHGRHLRTLAV